MADLTAMTLSTPLTTLAEQEFVLLTTFRKNGEAVPTPVWLARRDSALVVSTPEGVGKLKRLKHTPRVELQPCSRRGTQLPGTPVMTAHTVVSRDAAMIAESEGALAAKYGWQWRIMMLIERVMRRGRSVPRPVLLITDA